MFALILVLLTAEGQIMIPPQTPIFRSIEECQAKGAEVSAAITAKNIGHIFASCNQAVIVTPDQKA